MTTWVEMYHPALPGTPHIRSSSQAVAENAARGWLVVDGSTPVPTDVFLSPFAGDLRYLKVWTPNEVLTAGAVRLAADGHVITRNANGTARATYDTTEQAAWTVVSAGGASLPTQTGNSGKFLTTDGSAASWGTVAGGPPALTPTATKTASYTAAAGDLAMMNVAGGATVLTLPTAPANKAQVAYRAIGATTAVPLTINRGGSTDTIGTTAATSATVALADETVVLQYDAPNTRWLAVANVKTQASLDAAYQRAAQVFAPSPFSRAMAPEVALSPAVTFTEGTTSSTLSSPRNYPSIAAGAPFKLGLSDTLLFATNYMVPYGPTTSSARAADVSQALTVAFDFDGQAFELDVNASSTLNFRVWANEQQSAAFGPPGSNARKFIKVDFGSRAYRRVVVEFDTGSYFAGVTVAGTDTITLPSRNSTLKFAGVGDSYMFGTGYRAGSLNSARSYFLTTARELGFSDVRRYGVSGTGYVAGSPSTYIQRISDVLSYQPDVVLVQGSINDAAQTTSAMQTAATTYLTALKAGLPATSRIVCTSPIRALATIAADTTVGNGISAAAASLGIPYIDATGWFTGSGNIGATAGNGNADFYQSNSPLVHPSPAGHFYLGNQMARAVASALSLSL